MSKVSAVMCENYKIDEVQKAIDETFKNLGGINKFIKKGDRVFLKLNLVMKKHPDDAVTSHPAVVEAVAKRLVEAGARVIAGDSPGGPYSPGLLKSLYSACGIEEAVKRAGAELNYDCSFEEYSHPHGVSSKKLILIKPMMECDKIITISKLKTHGMIKYTGAVKIMFGGIPGLIKAEYHFKMPNLKDFSNLLVDICTFTKPVLSIIDGIYGMEGHGPTAGTPVHSKTVLASESPYNADIAGAHIMGIPPFSIETIQRAVERNLCKNNVKDLEVIGYNLDKLKKAYKVPNTKNLNFFVGKFPKPMEKFLNNYLSPKPVFSQELCVGCAGCKQSCPPGAIVMVNGRPRVDLDKCIKCFCCQELCPKKAVQIKRSWLIDKLLK